MTSIINGFPNIDFEREHLQIIEGNLRDKMIVFMLNKEEIPSLQLFYDIK